MELLAALLSITITIITIIIYYVNRLSVDRMKRKAKA